MRIKSLSLKNYRQYKDSSIELGDGITGIVGLNGAGKSTLIEAIAWTLYGPNAARTGKEGIKRSNAPMSSSVETELIMEIGGTEYKIVRVLKGASQTGDASIISGGKVIADSIKGVDKEVHYLLGMDWKSFYTSFFAKQKELNALTELTPAARRDTIIRMLRIDAVDKVADSIKKQIRDKKLELDLLKKKTVIRDPNLVLSEKMAVEKKKKSLEKELAETEKEIKIMETNLTKFKARFNEERAVSDKYNGLDKKRTAIEARLTGISKREAELSDEVDELEKLAKSLPAIEEAYKEYNRLNDEANKLLAAKDSEAESTRSKESINTMMEDLKQKAKELVENENKLKPNQPCPTCGQPLKDFTKIREHFVSEKKRIKSEYARLKELLTVKPKAFDQNTYEALSEKLRKLEAPHEQYPVLKAQVLKKARSEEMLTRIKKERKDLESDLKGVLVDMKDIPFDPKKHSQITDEYDEANTSLNKTNSSRNDIKLEIKGLATQIEEKQKEIDDAEETRNSISKITLSQEKYERFINLVTDYRQFLISRIRPKLAEVSGLMLTELTDGKYSGVELDEEYNLYIYDGNEKYPLPRFSGGETDIANLCLRLAISQLIAESSGAETGFIILDEIFGSQDLHRKSAILEALNKLTKQYRQIILITHVEDIKDTVENIIEVTENEEGISSVKPQ